MMASRRPLHVRIDEHSKSVVGKAALSLPAGSIIKASGDKAHQELNNLSRSRNYVATPTVAAGEQERGAGLPVRHFNQIDLSRRWQISPRTLERWRWLDQGPPYLKIGGRVAYRLEDIETFETAQRHEPKAGAKAPMAW